MHSRLVPREGFCADVLLRLVRGTVLNPWLLLPLVLLARFTTKGEALSILHPTATKRLRRLLYVALARRLSSWFSDKARNNWADDEFDWSKEIVVVTGGAGGIGGCIVRLLEARGVTVVVLDVQPLSYEASSKVHYFHCDLRSAAGVEATAAVVRAEVGHPTVVINNAGVAPGKTLLASSPEDVRLTFDVNTLALFWTARAFVPHMAATNHGMVVTVASYASWLTVPNMVDYGASKAAALAVHEGLAAELLTRYDAPRVRTVVVHPGHVKTALFKGYQPTSDFVTPSLEPESVAEAVVRQVLRGRSGTVVLPEAGAMLAGLRALPDWYAVRLRAQAQSLMLHFRGRQVFAAADDLGPEGSVQGGGGGGGGDSTVLVSSDILEREKGD